MKKNRKQLLAIVLVICMAFTMQVPAAAASGSWYDKFTMSARSNGSYGWNDIMNGIDDWLNKWFGSGSDSENETGTDTGETSGSTDTTDTSETVVNEPDLDSITADYVPGTLRATTYSLPNDAATYADSTTRKYFPITLYNYDADTINNATHQVEVNGKLGNTWNGIYFSNGSPAAESYTYSTESKISYTSTTVWYSSDNNYNTYINNGYYVDVNGTKYLVTGLSCTRTGKKNNYQYSWTITYAGGTATASGQTITLYKQSTSSTATTASLPYAAWNWWNKNGGDNKYGQYTYSGLVESELVNNEIVFTKPDGGIFNNDKNVKTIYTEVKLPFAYDKGTYTFDTSLYGVFFHDDSADGTNQGSTTAKSSGKLYFSDSVQTASGMYLGDGSTTVWAPFNDTTEETFTFNNGTYSINEMDYHFGMRANIPFSMTANGRISSADDTSTPITFSFSGDDDVWIFIDKELVIDLGGIHNRIDAEINFASNTITYSVSNSALASLDDAAGLLFKTNDGWTSETGTLTNSSGNSGTFTVKYTHKLFNDSKGNGILNKTLETFAATSTHELTIFYLERGKGSSNCRINFNLPIYDSVSVTKKISGTASVNSDGSITTGSLDDYTDEQKAVLNNLDFGFTLYKKNADETFSAVANKTYLLIGENNQVIDAPQTDPNGYFTLKNGQTAKFTGAMATDGSTYYVVEDIKDGFIYTDFDVTSSGSITDKNKTYKYARENGAYYVTDLSVNGGKLNSGSYTVSSASEAEDSLNFVCKNYVNASLPTPSAIPSDDQIVIDYGLPVQIDILKNDYSLGDTSVISFTDKVADADGYYTAQYGKFKYDDSNGIVTYQLTKQLTGVEVINYTMTSTATAEGEDAVTASGTANIYIIPATSMYYEENFGGLVTFTPSNTTGTQNSGWTQIIADDYTLKYQEPGVVGTVADSPYGSDKAYIYDSGDSNGTSMFGDTSKNAIRFSYTFTGTGTSFFARTDLESAYMMVKVTDSANNTLYTLYRDNRYDPAKDNPAGPLYNIPVFTWDAEANTYGTYTVTVTLRKKTENIGGKFYLDGIRVQNPMDLTDSNTDPYVSLAKSAYSTDGEANMTFATLRDKLISETQLNQDGTISWNEGDNFVVFTDISGTVTSAEDYKNNGPKEEVYLYNGQSVTFSLANWDTDTNRIYLGIKAPTGSGTVSINGHELELKNSVDCYYDITEYKDITTDNTTSTKIATFKIEAKDFEDTNVKNLISVTNIKVTGEASFAIITSSTGIESRDFDFEGDTGDDGSV